VKNFVAGFGQWSRVFENRSDEDISQKIEDLRNLADLGMIDQQEITDFLRQEGAPALIKYSPEIQAIVNTPEYSELQSHGLELVSSRTQLLNGSIIFGFPGYRRHNGYAIGLFPFPKLIRRMTPKGIPLGVKNRRVGSLDFEIKRLGFVASNQFYQVAMRWILDHIDLSNPKFPVKQNTRKGYFD
jgi:hypothetical protein